MKKITIPYFPTGIKYATPLLIGLGIYIWTIGYPIWLGILTLLAIIILTTNYVTEINLDKKQYRDFLSFLWMPFEEEKMKFKMVDKIVITKGNHSQMLNSRSRSRSLDWSSFTGTLIIDENKTLDLLTRTDRKELIKGLKEFVDFLKVDIEDQTTSEHFKVDITKY
jgi:hypothetical protein